MRKISVYIVLCAMLAACQSWAQEKSPLKLDEAVKLSLENSFNIKITAQSRNIAKVYNNPGTAGILPSLTLNAGYGGSINNIDQRFSNGLQVQQNGVANNSTNANAAVNWVFFDGLRMVYAKKRLALQENMSEITVKDSVQSVMSAVMITYYKIIVAQKQLLTLSELIKVSEERLGIAEAKFKTGSADKTLVLQSRLDLNAQKSLQREQQFEIQKLKMSLNLLMGREAIADFEPTGDVPMGATLSYEALRSEMTKNNPAFLISEALITQTSYRQKELQAQQYPWLSLNAGYGYNLNRNQAGFALYNQNLGFTYGVNLSYPLFAGYTIRPQLNAMKIERKISEQQRDFTTLRLESRLRQAYAEYEMAIDLWKLEESNEAPARENMDIALARFRVGTTDQLTLRVAQQSYLEAVTRYQNALIRVKLTELQLLRLAGLMVK